jgi:hypothetical protein
MLYYQQFMYFPRCFFPLISWLDKVHIRVQCLLFPILLPTIPLGAMPHPHHCPQRFVRCTDSIAAHPSLLAL